ncbi:MAG: MFS transporter [Bacteroidota bacterium]|nr:MFS transporter [Bacteroidota bacterium]
MDLTENRASTGSPYSLIVIVAALGYFVDLYDLVLFGVVRDASLIGVGVIDKLERIRIGENMLSIQMIGMLIGGILWGVLGDKMGRLKVLFGSIIMYSVANIANGLVENVQQYEICRFIAGVGLAGELGAGITLIAESTRKEQRGVGTMVVVVFGALGAVTSALTGSLTTWRTSYFIGGVLGLGLLALRVGVSESSLFKDLESKRGVSKGNFFTLFSSARNLRKYFSGILIGLPIWFTISTFIIGGPEFAEKLMVQGEVTRAKCILYAYLGLSLGDIISGTLCQILKSRKQTLYIFLATTILSCVLYLTANGVTVSYFYLVCFLIGALTGYWAIFVMLASEQFGTNLRATVTTSSPNFVRAAVYPIAAAFQWLRVDMGYIGAATLIGGICIGLAILATTFSKETFHKDLNYLE